MTEQESTREKIKAAAFEEFASRGYDGARMQEIANHAGVNKAMIHYYFQTKENLFRTIILEAFKNLFVRFSEIWRYENLQPNELIPKLVHTHLQFLADQPYLPQMMGRELNSGNPIVENVLKDLFDEMLKNTTGGPAKLIANWTQSGLIRNVDPQQSIWNIVALNLFIFIAKPLLKTIWSDDFKDEKELLAKREKAIVDLLLYGLLPR
jgi:TetR/AcrR family transcriptional regulator